MRRLMSALLLVFSVQTWAIEGMVSVASPHSVRESANQLEQALREKNMQIFQRIDHAAAARKNNAELRPTILIIFGNPKVGTPLMQCGQTVAIDLPQKMLIWESEDGKVQVSYNDMNYLKKRHKLGECGELLDKVSNALAGLAAAAVAP